MNKTAGGTWKAFTAGDDHHVLKKATTMVRLMCDQLFNGLKILLRTTDKVASIMAIKVIIESIKFVAVSYIIHNNLKLLILT